MTDFLAAKGGEVLPEQWSLSPWDPTLFQSNSLDIITFLCTVLYWHYSLPSHCHWITALVHVTVIDTPVMLTQEFREVESAFHLECFTFNKSLLSNPHCDWYHEEWRLPPRYIGNAVIDPTKSRHRLKAEMEYSGTWRARWGNMESVYYIGEFSVLYPSDVASRSGDHLIHCTTAVVVYSTVLLDHLSTTDVSALGPLVQVMLVASFLWNSHPLVKTLQQWLLIQS